MAGVNPRDPHSAPVTPLTPIVPVAPVTPATVSVPLPAGMSQEAFLKAITTYNTAVEKGKKVGKADGSAFRTLRDNHKAEFLKIRIEAWKKEGLDSTNLKE